MNFIALVFLDIFLHWWPVFSSFFSQQGLCNRPGLLDDYQHDNNVNKTQNHPVILTQRVHHLGSRTCVKGYFDAKVTQYSNSASAFNIPRLVQCGDVEINPGPEQSSTTTCTKPIWKHPCGLCTKSVRSNQKGILCDGCNKWFHLKCISIDLQSYFDLGSSNEQWFCDINCGWPFNFTNSFFEPSFSTMLNVSLSSSASGVLGDPPPVLPTASPSVYC